MTATASPTSYYGARNAYLDEFTISERYEDLMASARNDPTARMVVHFVDAIVRADEDIIRLGREITDRIERVAAKVASRQHIATLGELQRTPVEYDQACTARQTAIENLRHVAAAYREAHTT